MTRPQSEIGSVVAFYGLIVLKTAASFYENILDWFEANNCVPDKLGVVGKGFSGKQAAFKRTNKRLVKSGFQGVGAVSVTSLQPGGSAATTDWQMAVSISLRNSYVILAANSSIIKLNEMVEFARTAIQHLKPCYGIGFAREMALGPSLYAIGLNYGTHTVFSGPQYEEKLRITQWGNAITHRAYKEGFLRDVYPYNFLTEPQLSRRVEGRPLHEWIKQDAKRGQLVQFEGDVWLWSLQEKAFPQVRRTLRHDGVIFDAESFLDS